MPLQEGGNAITVTATDLNGQTATITRTITAQQGHYIRIVPSADSGTAPLNITFRLDGSFNINGAQVTCSGPATAELLALPGSNEFALNMEYEGTYTLTASAIGPDGQTYNDTKTITVISESKLDTLLRKKWDGMRTSLAHGDILNAIKDFSGLSKDSYRQLFMDNNASLPVLASGMGNIALVKVQNNMAEYDMRDTIGGTEYSFCLKFVRDIDGLWKILNY